MKKKLLTLIFAATLPCLALAAPGDLAKAAMNNDVAQVTKLLAAGGDANDRAERRATALMFAAQNGNLELVQALLKAGADVKATRDDEVTAMHHAAAAGTMPVVGALVAAGAVIDAKTARGTTPLGSALSAGNLEVASGLLDMGADLKATTAFERALSFALSSRAEDLEPQPFITRAFAERLLAAGADPASTVGGTLAPQGGANALLLAAAQRHQPELVALLVSRGADAGFADTKGATPLIYASRTVKFETVLKGLGSLGMLGGEGLPDPRILVKSMLSDREPTPEQKALGLDDARGRMSRISARRAATLRALLDSGADVKHEDSGGRSALYELGQSLDAASVGVLVAAGADPLRAPEKLQPPLHQAALNGLTDTLKAMLASGVDPDSRNEKQQTPLMLACSGGGDVETSIALLESGADVTARDGLGNTPLHYAVGAEEGFLTMNAVNQLLLPQIAVLLAQGADPSARNKAGKKPSELAGNKAKYKPAVKPLREAEKKAAEAAKTGSG